MQGFARDEFCRKMLEMYPEARENNYMLKLNEDKVRELKALYIDLFIPMENLSHYNDAQIMKKMMTKMVSIYALDKETATSYGKVVELVNTVNYDGRNLYVRYAKLSKLKLIRFEHDITTKQLSERCGVSVSTINNCEEYYCDMTRQPERLVNRLSKALDCSPEDIITYMV